MWYVHNWIATDPIKLINVNYSLTDDSFGYVWVNNECLRHELIYHTAYILEKIKVGYFKSS